MCMPAIGFSYFFLQMLLQLEVKVNSLTPKRTVPLDEDAQWGLIDHLGP